VDSRWVALGGPSSVRGPRDTADQEDGAAQRYWLYYALQFICRARGGRIFVVLAGFIDGERVSGSMCTKDHACVYLINLIANSEFLPRWIGAGCGVLWGTPPR